MTSKLEKIQQILADQENSRKGNYSNDNNNGASAVYPFWKMDAGQSTTLRFLPDGNKKNPLIWAETQVVKLKFQGIKGQQPKDFEIKVPCVEMWDMACPILGHIRKEQWFKDSSTEEMGRQYWKKRSWIFQGFVVEDGIGEEETPENPIRRFIFGNQIFEPIREGFLDPELETSPDDYVGGTDFEIKKKTQGGFGNYSSSKFKRNARSLNEAELAAIDEYGLSDLSTFLPKKPTDEELALIFEMFMDSVNGEYYDATKYGHLPWRPYGLNTSSDAPSVPKAKATSSADDNDDADNDDSVSNVQSPVVNTKESTAPLSADDILAQIRGNK